MTGYIKDHRKELLSDIWQMPPLYHRTWQWLKYNVNHEDNCIPMRDGSRMLIKRGQRLTSVRDVAKAIGWYEGRKRKEPNPKTVSAILDWMEKTGMIFLERGKGNREYTLITLVNYEVYNHHESQGNGKVTPRGAGGKQSADINKNEENEKNESINKDYVPVPEVITYLNSKAGTKYRASSVSAKKHVNARWNDGYTIEDFQTVIDKKCGEWMGTDMEKYLSPDTLFGTKFEKYLNQKTSTKTESKPYDPFKPELDDVPLEGYG